MSKRSVGLQFRESVLTSLTALSRSASSITQRNVDSAVDYVFEQASSSAARFKLSNSSPTIHTWCSTQTVDSVSSHTERLLIDFHPSCEQWHGLQVFGTSFVDDNLIDLDEFI